MQNITKVIDNLPQCGRRLGLTTGIGSVVDIFGTHDDSYRKFSGIRFGSPQDDTTALQHDFSCAVAAHQPKVTKVSGISLLSNYHCSKGTGHYLIELPEGMQSIVIGSQAHIQPTRIESQERNQNAWRF